VRAKGKTNRRVDSDAALNEAPDDDTSAFQAVRSSAPAASHAAGAGARPAGGNGVPRGQAGDDQDRDRQPADAGPSEPREREPGRGGVKQLKNWRVRSRLLLLVTIPTLAALIFGGFSIFSSVQSAQADQRVHQLAVLGQDVTVLAQSLEDERDQTVFYIALGGGGGRADGLSSNVNVQSQAAPELTSLAEQYHRTNAVATKVRTLSGQIGGGYPAQTRQAATAMVDALDTVSSLRSASTETQLPLLVVVQKYSQVIDTLLGFNNGIAQGVGDPTLAQTVDVLGLVSQMKEDASVQRAILAAALSQGSFGPGELAALQQSVSAQQTTLQAFDTTATPAQLQLWNDTVSNVGYGEEQQALSIATAAGASQSLSNDPTTPDDWYDTMSGTVRSQMGSVEHQLVGAVISRSESLRSDSITLAAIVGALVLLVLALGTLFTVFIGRSMVRPLRRLRTDALSIAGVQLPSMVRRLSESEGEEGELKVKPVAVDSTDEIGEVARAFDQVHAEAVRLASNEARLRGNVNAMFVNLSRRSQSLVERQIHLIDDLEQGEQDSDRLGSLFRLDHLATRMRRNSENLLVLAGYEAARRWTQPVALVDVLRAAVSEIEHYERVVLNVQPGIAVRGQVVNDVVHLLAELVENATAFSSAQTQVNVSGHLLNSGGVLLDITDQGVGMAADEMAHANWRLDNPPVVDVSVSRRMGLFVVARLATRHGIRVRLRPAPSGGLTALIWLPDETVTHEVSDLPPGLRRFELDSTVASGSLAGFRDLLPGAPGGPDGPDARTAAQEALAAARAPRFMAIDSDADAEQPKVPEQLGSSPGDGSPPLPRRDSEPLTAGDSDLLPPADAGPLPVRDAGPLPVRKVDPLPVRNKDPLPVRENGNGALPVRGKDPLPVRESNGSLPIRGAVPFQSDKAPSGQEQEKEPVFGAPTKSLAEELGATVADQGWLLGKHAEHGQDSQPGTLSRPPVHAQGMGTAATDDVIVPPVPAAEQNRLPIFESVESDWFRRGRHHAPATAPDEDDVPEIAAGWSTPVDEGWRAAEAAESPTSAGVTSAGLPKRVPQANLVPGAAAEDERTRLPDLVRSAAATRQRMTSFQRGSRQGRAALQGDEVPGGEDKDAT
jgi:signal transduction histidine kinase